MQLTQIPQALALLAAYSFIDSYFYSPIFISFILVIVTWACVNIWLLRRLPENSPARVTWRVMGLTVRPAEELARVGCAMATLTDLALPVAPDDRVVDDSLKLPWSSADDNDDARLPAGSTSATPSAVAFDPRTAIARHRRRGALSLKRALGGESSSRR